MSDWKTAYRSFYYATAEPLEEIVLSPQQTALAVIDIQNTYLEIDSDIHAILDEVYALTH
jgi:hypothetical protein